MATKNPITGDELISKAPTEAYKQGWERIFARPVKTYTGGVPALVRCETCDCDGTACNWED